MAKNVEVVMFFGPPIAGKTAYYRRNLKISHERISAVELFKEDPELGLRQVILRIVSVLKQGRSVVIDDENWSSSTRLSYVKSISSKVPNCKFRCIKFNPDSQVTLRWLQEWHLAESVLSHEGLLLDDIARHEGRILQWFGEDVRGKKLEIPTAQEGLSLQDVQVELTTEVEYKFEVPALFIQLEGIIQRNDDETFSYLEGTRDVLQTWTTCNPWGRIIVISDTADCADSPRETSSNHTVAMLKQTLTKLCQSLPSPVYFCTLDLQSPSFAKPPHPGLLAFLQRFHHIHLWHSSTLYIHHSKDHANCAQVAGVKTLKAAAALKSPRLVNLTQCSSKADVHPVLKDIRLIGPDSGQERSTPRIPLYQEAVDSGEEGCFVQDLACRRALGICFKDKDTLQRYQKLYAETATHVRDPGTRMMTRIPNIPTADSADSAITTQHPHTQAATQSGTQLTTRGLPSWMLSQSLKTGKKSGQLIGGESLEDSSLEEQARKEKSDIPTLPSTVYCMSAAELYETALLILQENESSDHPQETHPKDASSSEETRAPLPITTTNAAAYGDELQDSTSATATSENGKKVGGGEAQLLDDIFLTESPGIKPPPRKTKFPKKTEKLPSVLPKCFAPETVTCVPETTAYIAASMGPKESSTDIVGESSKKQKKEGAKTNKEPDFCFLDDIF